MIEAYGQRGIDLSRDRGRDILDKWVFFQAYLRRYQEPSPLSVRQIRWWLWVHIAAPDLGYGDAFWLAHRFVVREQMHDVLGLPLFMEDLDAHLAFRPWGSTERRQAYLDAVEDKVISRRPDVEPLYQVARLKRRGLNDSRPVGMAMMSSGIPGAYPELLVSQQARVLERLVSGVPEEDALLSAFDWYATYGDAWHSKRSQFGIAEPNNEQEVQP